MTRTAVVGGGWAGLAAAVAATEAGQQVTLIEAARTLGGRARAVLIDTPDGPQTVDNGQHILIGAYTATLDLMQRLGIAPEAVLHAMPLALPFADGTGLRTPAWAARWPAPLDALAAIATTPGWTWRDKVALVLASVGWQVRGFQCDTRLTVARLCQALPARVNEGLIEPLCVSALNTPAHQASAAVFLRVLKDALFGRGHGAWNGSTLLLPRADLGALLPEPARQWLLAHGAHVHTGRRVLSLAPLAGDRWQVDGEAFDRVLLAAPPGESARLLQGVAPEHPSVADWIPQALALRFEAIATVYGQGSQPLPGQVPMMALRPSPQAPAQFVFDRGQLGGPPGLLAFVVSASHDDRQALQAQVMEQALALGLGPLRALQTVVEKRATFACTPALLRPASRLAPRLWAVGDYVDGPYPATLEGAVRCGLAAGARAD
ncbi:hydroxysqualene dehydroxylase HpnE [Hydrogenophaga sp. OTU3427]|uniref:hydroxysqualene dehydroxylase HpnE n=1 Tax=Hydrogenophaga sp. OTU3427 TaxID=3043856 RepID=UPI00313DE18D